MATFLESIKETWNKLSLPMRIGGSVAVIGVFIFLLVIAFSSSGKDYHPLYTDLELSDSGAIIDILYTNGINYKISDNGTTILVPESSLYETRIMLASQGLPNGGVVGFETFSSTRLGETEADRQLRYKIALEGELTRTILTMEGVDNVRLHIVMPQRSLFIQNSQPATASVLLTLKPGVQLSTQQVRGISHLLATSVESLSTENITIVDNRGNVLSDYMSGEMLSGTSLSQRLELKLAYEKQLSTNLTSMLERIYGFGKIVASVNVDLDFDQVEEYSEVYSTPTRDGGLVRSEQSYHESYLNSDNLPQGVPGVDSNIPGYIATDDSNIQGLFNKQETITNYEYNRTETKQISAPGKVTHMSVSLWVNGQLSQAELTNLEQAVISATGLRQQRGDNITVTSLPFSEDTSTADSSLLVIEPAISYWIYILIGGLLLLIVMFILIRSRKHELEEVEEPVAIGIDYTVTDEEQVQKRILSPEEKLKHDSLARLQKHAKDDPKDIARIIKSWMLED